MNPCYLLQINVITSHDSDQLDLVFSMSDKIYSLTLDELMLYADIIATDYTADPSVRSNASVAREYRNKMNPRRIDRATAGLVHEGLLLEAPNSVPGKTYYVVPHIEYPPDDWDEWMKPIEGLCT